MRQYQLLLVFFVCSIYALADTIDVDTIYYDNDWKGVSSKHFASFFRVIESNPTPGYSKKFKDYYITGELQGDGQYISIDKFDDKNSVMDGPCSGYFKSGKLQWKKNFDKGKAQGEAITYYEDGTIKERMSFENGLPHGLYTFFNEKGLCIQQEYYLGSPRYEYYTVSSNDGLFGKFRMSDNTPIYTSPSITDKKVEYKDGQAWQYYINDGICISLTNVEINDYGKYFRIFVNITNNSFNPIIFDPIKSSSTLVDNKGKEIALEIQSATEYDKRIRRTQRWEEALAGFANGLAAASAGYSTSTTHSSYSGYSNSYGNASAYGSGGYAYGTYSGSTSYYGSGTSTTRTYDAGAAYQAQLAASQQMAAMTESNFQVRQSRNEGYLKKTTINPGESISGYFNIKRKKGESMTVFINLEGSTYPFPWNIKK